MHGRRRTNAHNTRGRLRLLTLAVSMVAALVLSGCTSSGDDATTDADPVQPASVTTSNGDQAAPRALARHCAWNAHRKVPSAKIRRAFIDREHGDVRLLLAAERVRPGEILSVAIANDSPKTITYGTPAHMVPVPST